MVLQWCYNSIAVMLQWCYSGGNGDNGVYRERPERPPPSL
jgi:hypothetical protein